MSPWESRQIGACPSPIYIIKMRTFFHVSHTHRLEENGTFTALATHYQGQRLNSPNDVVFGPGGDLYFTDPPYGLNVKEEDPSR